MAKAHTMKRIISYLLHRNALEHLIPVLALRAGEFDRLRHCGAGEEERKLTFFVNAVTVMYIDML